ncbi:MAG TPA: hypothetical protein VF173_13090 [Thermoanaerobaculia bacterium]|nr:hypothetical protein [Thermoanaerobaculia bacterium]
MNKTRWIAVLLLLAVAIPCQAIIITCDDICTCNSSCRMGCKIDGFTPSTCGAIGTCHGGGACLAAPPVTTMTAATTAATACPANATPAQPAFLTAAPAQP